MLQKRLRQAVQRIARSDKPPPLLSLEGALYPLLQACSVIFESGLLLRQGLYRYGILQQARLPLPVISVGNITWGGNGKTPMAQYLAEHFIATGVAPLIVTRGYGGGDEVRLLERHLAGSPGAVAVGADRAAAVWAALRERGFSPHGLQETPHSSDAIPAPATGQADDVSGRPFKVGILDDGMQNLRTARDLEIVMVNAVRLWGNGRLIPAGPLRERPHALVRGDVVVLHHADLVSQSRLAEVKAEVRELCRGDATLVCTHMKPCHFVRLGGESEDRGSPPLSGETSGHPKGGGRGDTEREGSKGRGGAEESAMELDLVRNAVVLCVSGVGSPETFRLALEKLGAWHVESRDFDDHHHFDEQDYMRDPVLLRKHLGCSGALVLVSKLAMVNDLDTALLEEALQRRPWRSSAPKLGTS